MIWFDWISWHINHCRLFNVKSYLYIYIKHDLSEFIFLHTVKWSQVFLSNTNNSFYYQSFFCTQLNGSYCCYVS